MRKKKGKTKKKRLTIQDKAVLALKQAVKGVIEEHKRTGRSLVIWKDNRVAWISPFTRKEVGPN